MPEVKGNNQLGKPGVPLEPFMATFRDPEGEPITGMPAEFVLVKGEGELNVSDIRTDLSGGICAELIPDGKTKLGRVELRYGEKLENMLPFLYIVEGAQEQDVMPRSHPVRPAAAPAKKPGPAKAAPVAARPVRRPAPSKRLGIRPKLVIGAVVIVAFGLSLLGFSKKLGSQPPPKVDLIVDCTRGPLPKRVGNYDVYEYCPIFRK